MPCTTMMNALYTNSLLAMLFALASLSVAQFQESDSSTKHNSKITVKFELFAPTVEDGTTVFITGSLGELGDWNPAKIRMKPLGEHRWTYQLTATANYPIEYKYTLGSWSKEGANAQGIPLPNFAIRPKKDTTAKDQIKFWTDGTSNTTAGQITGTVKYHRQIKFDGLLPRDVIVWLPPQYEKSNDRYPVLYMHDGQNIVDPKTSAFGKDWEIDETCTRLITAKKIPPIIVVGIYNTSERNKDYLPGPQGQLYGKFICNKLKPLIDRTYRTQSSRESTAIGGSSAGGICAFCIAWTHADVFSKAICISPSFQYRRQDGTLVVDYVTEFTGSAKPDHVPFFYIDNGGVGLEEILQPGIDAMLNAMNTKGLKRCETRNLACDYVWKKFPDDRHNESAWAKRIPTILEMIYSR